MKKRSRATSHRGILSKPDASPVGEYFGWSNSDRCAPAVFPAQGVNAPNTVSELIRRIAETVSMMPPSKPSGLRADIQSLVALYNRNQFAEAVALSVRMMTTFQAEGDEAGLAHTLFWRGAAQAREADLQGAIASLRHANAIYGKLGMPGHAARALAAEGAIGLADARPEVRDEGAHLVQQAVCRKLGCPDRGGIGRDFMMLSRYALGLKQMSRALGHGRRGLKLSLMQGDVMEILYASQNLIEVYLASRLYKRATQVAEETLTWAKKGRSTEVIMAALELQSHVNAAQAKRGGYPKKFLCPCSANVARKSNGQRALELKDCCGLADRDPVEVDWGFCLAPQHGPYRANPDAAAFNLTVGEYVDREASGDKPEGFLIARFHDGWLETFGLPHLANYHLKGARAACEAVGGPLDVGFPIAAVLLATSSLEAFVNGVAHVTPTLQAVFGKNREEAKSLRKRTEPEIVAKWMAAGSMLCKEGWLEPKLLGSLRELVRLRNSLVHFEPCWEMLDEPPKMVPFLSVEHRTEALWWPHAAMADDTGSWAVSTAERLMAAFRTGLREESRGLCGSTDLLMRMKPS